MSRRSKIGEIFFLNFVTIALFVLGMLSSSETHAFTVPLISAETLKDIMDKGQKDIVIVDTQSKDMYRQAHIQGAINFPWSTDICAPENLPYDKMLILYCDSPDEKESSDVAKHIQSWDYVRIKILKGGLREWKKLEYPTVEGEDGAPQGSADEKIARITIDELKKLIDQGADLVIVDVQSKDTYAKNHIKGAISLPWKPKILTAEAAHLPKHKLIVTYCDCGPGEADSNRMAQQLVGLGFTDVKVLADPAIRGWIKASYPVEKKN